MGSKISDIACSNILSNISPQTWETKGKINKWDYIKLKKFLHSKENQRHEKTIHSMGEHICQYI